MSVHLLSSDNEEFKVDKDVAERSVLIKNMLEGKYRHQKTFFFFFTIKKAVLFIDFVYLFRYWGL